MKSSIMKLVGNKIRHYRLQQKMTQEQLAEAIDTSGTYIGRLERGEQNMQLLTLEKIASALHIDVSALFNIQEAQTSEQFFDAKNNQVLWNIILLLEKRSKSDQQRAYRVLKEMFTP
ncbi:helix-turn-helix domain-containing protein [Paenibacillus sp. FJAT-26967]|uniref:helix-turn-helix domain-containing protein n=1 Tax=Paenibacillus sp. FJAT-26967 TaxID=1729690 RepID=UPI000837E649|nr:helix-turn-helix transcriptional regulator [Paenibacillus sp. FJAT-26967]